MLQFEGAHLFLCFASLIRETLAGALLRLCTALCLGPKRSKATLGITSCSSFALNGFQLPVKLLALGFFHAQGSTKLSQFFGQCLRVSLDVLFRCANFLGLYMCTSCISASAFLETRDPIGIGSDAAFCRFASCACVLDVKERLVQGGSEAL